MKFKYLLIAFTIMIVTIILLITLLPQILLGSNLALNFRFITLPVLILMIALLVFMGIYYIINYRLLSLLEREDWPALSYYLEQKIFVKGSYSSGKIRLLASSYLVISDYSSVLKLESKSMSARPSVVEKNVLIFGAARVLSGNYSEAASFFKMYMNKGRAADRQWIHWFYGFSNLLNGAFNLAQTEFSSFALSSSDPLLTGLSSYFLHSSVANYSLKPDECRGIAETGRSRIKKALGNINKWKKEVEKMSTEIYIAIIRKYIDEAGNWLFSN